MKSGALLLLLFLFADQAFAATISGTAFEWYTLEPLQNIIVEINTTPKQTDVAIEGTYSFSISTPGNYTLTAQFFENNKLKYEAIETITLESGDGNFVVDLIMLPALGEDEFLFEDFNELGLDFEGTQTPNDSGFLKAITAGLALVLIALALFFAGARIRRKKITETKTVKESEMAVGSDSEKPISGRQPGKEAGDALSSEATEALEVLKRYGGRLTQLELREKLPYGEAKASLVVAELEHAGKVKKFKKGRGNIIIVK
ncbi:MAG: hypothetical protein J4224_05010 [Candidatus Diapherotrites archaeon]|uniref:DUF7343 domain-containing protein n=1 Tax=Candidatus Iainarchaeum sp. TaxID=3101447 RepID=A0A8T4L1L7_9ARCH|nr:hypothetical protein [Candidatus Diapherotrites archaeon]